jgi:hypothetical protein
VTEQSRKLALVLREPQKSKNITLSGSEIATRNQSWASGTRTRQAILFVCVCVWCVCVSVCVIGTDHVWIRRADDSVRSSSSETKAGDTKRTRRLSLNLSLISAVHKVCPRL